MAIKRKYLQYVVDPIYRHNYRERIYFNVNADVPEELVSQNRSQVHIIDRNSAQQLNQSMGSSILTKLPNKYNDNRDESKKHKMDAFVMDDSVLDEALLNQSLGQPLAHSSLRDINENDNDYVEYESDEMDDSPMSTHDLARQPIASTTQSKVEIQEFNDPISPNAKIRVEKSVVTQSSKQGRGALASSTTTQMRVQKTDPDGIVSEKQFSFRQGTVQPQIRAVDHHDRTNAENAIELYEIPNDSIHEALETVGQPSRSQTMPEGIPVASIFQSPRIIEWFVKHIPKGRYFDRPVVGTRMELYRS